MQTAPENWNALWNAEHELDIKAVINGVEYGAGTLNSCVVHQAVFSSLSIGQAASATLELSILPQGEIPKAAKIRLFARLRSGAETTYWVPQGVYYIDTRETDGEDGRDFGFLSLTAYDRMVFAEEDYFPDGVISGTWPKTAAEVVSSICARLGVELDSRTALDPSVMVDTPVDMTVRDVLCGIAAAHGGNFVFNAVGELRLVVLEGLPETADHVLACGSLTLLNQPVTVSRIVLAVGEETAYLAGNETGYSLEGFCPYATQALADGLLTKLGGMQYVPAEAAEAVFDPLMELGDAVSAGGHVFRAYSLDITYDPLLCTADIAAPIDGEVEHELPFKSGIEKTIDWKIAQTKAAIKITTDSIISTVEGVQGDVSEINQTVDSITLSVTSTSSEDGQTTAKITLKVGPNSYSGYIKLDGNVDVSGQLSADALYAALGDIADLTVDRLSTSRRIVKYLAGDQSDDNFVRIREQYIEFVSGVYADGTEQAENPNGALLYWEADPTGASIGSDGYPYVDGERIFTTTTETSWPVMVYKYDELVKRSIAFEQQGDQYVPVDVFGAGDANGRQRGRLVKDTDGLLLAYQSQSGKDLGLHMGDGGYTDIYGLRKTTGLNFSEWSSGHFYERIDGDDTRYAYNVEFDAQGRPIKITDGDGHETAIYW